MKNYFLASVVWLLIIYSLYSISALYVGSFTVQVGQSPSVQVGQSPTINVVPSSGGSSGASSIPPSSNGISVNFNTTGDKLINLSTTTSNTSIKSSSNSGVLSNGAVSNNHPTSITGSIIDSLTSATGLSVMGIAVLIVITAILLILKRRNISINHENL